MRLGSAQQLAKVDDVPVLSSQHWVVDTARNIGVVVDSQLSIYAHVAAVCSGGYIISYQLRQLKKCVTDEVIKALMHAFIRSRI